MGAKQKDAETTLDLAAIGNDPARERGTFRHIGGSPSDDWNARIAHETVQALSVADAATPEAQHATVNGLIGIAPQDEVEGMMAAQLLAAHSAAMDYYRRGRNDTQSMVRQHDMGAAIRLSRGFTTLLTALRHYRSLAAQKPPEGVAKG